MFWLSIIAAISVIAGIQWMIRLHLNRQLQKVLNDTEIVKAEIAEPPIVNPRA